MMQNHKYQTKSTDRHACYISQLLVEREANIKTLPLF